MFSYIKQFLNFSSYQLYFKELGKNSIPISCSQSDSLDVVFNKFYEKSGQNDKIFAFSFAGILLYKFCKVEDYQIPNGSTIHAFKTDLNELIFFIKIDDKTFYPFSLKQNSLIQDIKATLKYKCNIPVDQYKLKYENIELEDTLEIGFYNIKPESIITLIPFSIEITLHIFTNSNKTFSIDIRPEYQVIDLKNMITKELDRKIPSNNQVLLYKGIHLENEKTLDFYQIKDGDNLVFYEKDFKYEIKFRAPDGKKYFLSVYPNETQEIILQKIANLICLSSPSILLLFHGYNIVDHEFIRQNWEKCKMFELIIINENDNDIIASVYYRFRNKVIPVNVNINENISDVKKKLERRLGKKMEKEVLYYDGNVVDDNFDLKKITSIDRPNFVLEHKNAIYVFIIDLSGNKHILGIDPEERMYDLFNDVQKLLNINTTDFRLICGGKSLSRDKTVSYYNIENYSTIHFLLYLRG